MATARRSYTESRPVGVDHLECPDVLSVVERLGTRNEPKDEGEPWQFARAFLAPTFLAVGCSTVEELVERFGLSGEPSRRWKSRTANPADVRDGQGRELPKSVIDFIGEAERRGHPSTALDRSDDD
jgi:hypothetical protein